MTESNAYKGNNVAHHQPVDGTNDAFGFEYEQRVAQHLQMIQEPICRMSTTSAIFKGFSVTTTAGLISSAVTENRYTILLFSAVLIIPFMAMDVYYLKLERRFRYLFNLVREGNLPADFSMVPPKSPIELLQAEARTSDCLLSPSILPFYGLLIAITLMACCFMYIGMF